MKTDEQKGRKTRKAPVLPALDDEAGWQAWTLAQLKAISEEQSNAWMAGLAPLRSKAGVAGDGDKTINYTLRSTLKQLRETFPARTWTAPNGKTFTGASLSPGVVAASYGDNDDKRTHGRLMNMAVELSGEPAVVRWLMASGFDPTVFNPHTHNTPLGRAAYKGEDKLVRLFRLAGYPLDLRLAPHHLDDPNGKQAGLVGTTLLHRIAQRCTIMGDRGDAVLRELLLGGLDPLEENARGENAIFWARGGAKATLQQWVAMREQAELDCTTSTVGRGRRGLRL